MKLKLTDTQIPPSSAKQKKGYFIDGQNFDLWQEYVKKRGVV